MSLSWMECWSETRMRSELWKDYESGAGQPRPPGLGGRGGLLGVLWQEPQTHEGGYGLQSHSTWAALES